MENITFNEKINLFLKSKAKEILSLCAQESTCVHDHDAYACRHKPGRACRVSKFFTLKIEV